ncbi:MAG: hypothetical protein C5B47_03590 [Verrucomicrobia bacterium]|nr:MAG: hypothetical protein C5B47_03590 [Verrucomicrobiota bacterium]
MTAEQNGDLQSSLCAVTGDRWDSLLEDIAPSRIPDSSEGRENLPDTNTVAENSTCGTLETIEDHTNVDEGCDLQNPQPVIEAQWDDLERHIEGAAEEEGPAMIVVHESSESESEEESIQLTDEDVAESVSEYVSSEEEEMGLLAN